ncbi:MAG TPA: gluconokinase, partial [Anaerolineales bacterium]|nr:gluconokinase [Anaerolineales bacterium]
NRQGQVLALGVGEYPLGAGARRFEEQSAVGLFSGLVDSVRAARAQAGDLPGPCGGLSVGGALHSLLAVDESGEALTGVMTWADGRAAPQAAQLRSAAATHALYDQTGCPAHAMYPLYKLLWLRENEPAIFRRARRFVSAKEYVVARLTGEWRVDYNVAAGTGLLNAFSLDWHQPALELCAVDAERLSPLGGPLARLAGLSPGAAKLLGLQEGTPVFLGSSDAVNSNLGAGAVHPWQATCMIGTSGAYRIIADRPALDPQRRSWCYAIDRDHWLVGGAMNNGGLALTWLRDVLGREVSFEGLLDLAAQAQPGAEGLVCLPLFAGERSPNWNVHARGAFVGLTSRHELRHLARAVLEGIALRMRSLQHVLADLGLEIREVRASGGFTQSPFWVQVIADVLQQDLALPAFGETSSLGAGVWALAAAGELAEPAGIGE